jgi:hypothetical protein
MERLRMRGNLAVMTALRMQPGREADHSPPSSPEVKNGGAITLLRHTPSWHGA